MFEESSEGSKWVTIRDTIQSRKPFAIVVFRTGSSFSEASSSTTFREYDTIKQTFVSTIDGQSVKYPSLFFVLQDELNFKKGVKSYYEQFDIKEIVVGETNKEYSTLFSQDGTSSDFGNEIVSANGPSEFHGEDYFKIEGTCYRFIEFHG